MDTRRTGDGITGGLILIGIGVLLFTNWWWPGIMIVIGVGVAAGLVFRGRYIPALINCAIFFGIPVLVEANIPWQLVGPAILIGIGIIVLVKAFVIKESSPPVGQDSAGKTDVGTTTKPS
jgi:membrane protein implicated in regulation of membrane protease activity